MNLSPYALYVLGAVRSVAPERGPWTVADSPDLEHWQHVTLTCPSGTILVQHVEKLSGAAWANLSTPNADKLDYVLDALSPLLRDVHIYRAQMLWLRNNLQFKE